MNGIVKVTAEDRAFFKMVLADLCERLGYVPYDLSEVDKIEAIAFEPLQVETLWVSVTGDDW